MVKQSTFFYLLYYLIVCEVHYEENNLRPSIEDAFAP